MGAGRLLLPILNTGSAGYRGEAGSSDKGILCPREIGNSHKDPDSSEWHHGYH
jgi:hypothetical protein